MKLAKWEDRGHYAQKQEAEKSQRQLHKVVRDSQEVLKRPAARVIGSVSAAMGFLDVSKEQQEAGKEAAAAARPKKRARITESQPWSWQDKVGFCLALVDRANERQSILLTYLSNSMTKFFHLPTLSLFLSSN